MKKKEVIKILEDNKITNVIPERVFYKDENSDVVSLKEKTICPNCKGNGFTRHRWEEDDHELQCKACHSEGEVPKDKFFSQTYESKNWLDEWSTSFYHGPCLDYALFRKLRIILN